MADDRPIAVFDSGVGGLTVLKPLLEKFPGESFVYLGDTARLPYGTKSLTTLQLYLRQMADYLLERDIKALVIACHSASSAWLEQPFDLPVPVWEMITPACQSVLKEKPDEKSLGLLATKATVKSGAYEKVLKSLGSGRAVISQSCPLFVPLIEEGLEEDPVAADLAGRYLKSLRGECKTVVLGCTHYPLLRGTLEQVGEEFEFVDPAESLVQLMAEDERAGKWEKSSAKDSSLKLLTTDSSSDLWGLARRILHQEPLPSLELVAMAPSRSR